MTALAAARRQLLEVADQLETIQLTMLGIQGTLPEPAAESIRLLDVDEMDGATELRAVVGCVLNDYIGPAMRDLRDALAATEGEANQGSSEP